MAKRNNVLHLEIVYNFICFGIVSPYRDSRLCHFLNKEMQTHLRMVKSLVFDDKRKHELKVFLRYAQLNEAESYNLLLLQNKNETQTLYAKLPFDFFLFIEGENVYRVEEKVRNWLNESGLITLSTELKAEELPESDLPYLFDVFEPLPEHMERDEKGNLREKAVVTVTEILTKAMEKLKSEV